MIDMSLHHKVPIVDKIYHGKKYIHVIHGFNPVMTQTSLDTKFISKCGAIDYILNQKRYNDFSKY